MVFEAQRRFELLVQRATPDTITTSIEHARALYLTANPELDAKFHEAAEALAVDGTNAADTRRAWTLLRNRGHDDQVSRRLAETSERLVLGATSGGEETSVDLLAITLQLDDLLSAGGADGRVVELRVVAVRLFLALLDLYEKSMFVVQPTSHPPATDRWRNVVSQRLVHWFDDVDELGRYGPEMITALRELDTEPRLTDAADVHRGLGRRLDRGLGSFYDWSPAATLGRILIPTPAEALGALRRWPGWAEESDIEAEVGDLVAAVALSAMTETISR
jgi:hypothetical protein